VADGNRGMPDRNQSRNFYLPFVIKIINFMCNFSCRSMWYENWSLLLKEDQFLRVFENRM